jgi:hypothetical protein
MRNQTIHVLIIQARAEDLHRPARKLEQQRIAALAGRQTSRRTAPRSASIRRAIQQLASPTTSEAAAAQASGNDYPNRYRTAP